MYILKYSHEQNKSIYVKKFIYISIIWLDSFLQSDRLLVGQDYLVRTAGITNFSKNFQNSQRNFRRFSENFQKSKLHKKQFLNIFEAFRKLWDISDDFRSRRHLPEVYKFN